MCLCRHTGRGAGGAGPHARHVQAPQTVREAGSRQGLPHPAISTGARTPTGPKLALLRRDPSSQQAPCRSTGLLSLSLSVWARARRGHLRLLPSGLGQAFRLDSGTSAGDTMFSKPWSRLGSRFRASDTRALSWADGPAASAPPAGAHAFRRGRAQGTPRTAARTGPCSSEGTQESPSRGGPALFGLDSTVPEPSDMWVGLWAPGP